MSILNFEQHKRHCVKQGTLYIIASPIGNLEDITLRALSILKSEVEHVFCEDTRQTRKLLNRYEIQLPASSMHSHSSEGKLQFAVDLLKQGKSVAYLTDAGTPGLSDPGNRLVTTCRNENITISPIPGPSALTAAISVSGFSGKNIIFAGFLSKKPGKRKNELTELKNFTGTIAIYESPHRIKKLLSDIAEIFPGSEVLIAREMTKIHEEILLYPIEGFLEGSVEITEKGEFTVLIANTGN